MTQSAGIRITEEVFVQAYETHWRDLYVFCNKHVTDTEVSKELVQEIFISLWEKRHNRVIETTLKNYLFSALKLKILEYYRKQQVRDQYMVYKTTTATPPVNHTEKQIHYNELQHALHTAIQLMPERSREVYLLSRENGMDNKSIAATLLITEKAVEGNITRALAFIRKKLRLFNDN